MAAAGDVFAFALRARMYQQTIINTFAFRVDSMSAPLTDAALIEAFFNGETTVMTTRIQAPLRACQSEDMLHQQWEVRKVLPVETLPTVVPITWAEQGILADAAETANVAASITRYGDLAGRRNKGRIAIAGIVQAQYEQGLIGATLGVTLDVVGQGITGTYNSAALGVTISFGFFSPLHTGTVGGLPVTYPAQFVACPRYRVQPTVRVQRSRTVGVGI